MNIYNLTVDELERYFESIGEKKFKATQVYDWLYKKRVNSFVEMSNIKKEIISKLENDFTLEKPKIIKKQIGEDVYKYLFRLKGGI